MLTATPLWAFPVDFHGHFLHLCKLLTSTWTRGQKFHSVSTGSEKSHFFTPVLIMPLPNQRWLQFGKKAGECTDLPRAEQRSVKGGKIRGTKIAPAQHVLGASVRAVTSAALRSP